MKKTRDLLIGLLLVWIPGLQAQDLMGAYELALQNDPQLWSLAYSIQPPPSGLAKIFILKPILYHTKIIITCVI